MESAGARAAAEVAEAVRQLNHATIAGRGYRWPADVDAAIAQLQLAAGRLCQALEQAEAWLMLRYQAEAVGHDGEEDPGVVLARLSKTFGRTALTADQLERDLNAIRTETSHLTGQVAPARPCASATVR